MDDSDSYDSSASDAQSSSSDSYLYDSDGSYQYSYVIGNVRYSKKRFKTILYSDKPEDKEKVKSMIIDSIKEQNEALESLLPGSKLSVDEVLIKEKGQTAIHLAYYHDVQDSVVQMILDYMSGGHINSTDCYGLTHLHVGCWAENEDLVKRCIDDDADVNACFSRTDSRGNTISGITPLHLVCALGFSFPSTIVELLLKNGADVNAIDSLGRSSLHLACRAFAFPHDGSDPNQIYKNVEIMRVLLDHGCDVNKRDINGNTPLLCIYPESYYTVRNPLWPHCIPIAESVEKLKLILERGANVNVSNNDGDTVLHRLIRMLLVSNYLKPSNSTTYFVDPIRHVKMVEIILNTKKPVNINTRNSLGETPLQLAVSLMSANIVKVLLDHGADLSCLNFNQNDEYCFCCPYELPNLEQVYHIVYIMEMLLDKELKLTLKDNLMIMKFLVHDVKNCDCGNYSLYDDFENYYRKDSIENKLKNVMAFGSSKHFKYVFNEIIRSLSAKKLEDEKDGALFYVKALIHYNYVAAFHIEKEIVNFVAKIPVHYDMCENWHKKLEKEIACMKTIKLVEESTLYDIMIKHPHDIYQYTSNVNILNLKLSSKFDIYKSMIEGHIAKSLIRHYVEQSAYDYLTELSFALLPDLCTSRILHYLNNEDILNLCLSAVCEDEN